MELDEIIEMFFEELYSDNWLDSEFLENYIIAIEDNIEYFGENEKEAFLKLIKDRECFSEKEWIYKYSILMTFEKDNEVFKALLKMILYSDELEWDELYFLQGQVGIYIFMNPQLNTSYNRIAHWKILQKSFNKLKEKQCFGLKKIPASERNDNIAIVMCEQILGKGHGPTKTALDRCAKLQDMGKEVLLINTAELMTVTGKFPFVTINRANYLEELSNRDFLEWKGHKIPYIQCENKMPDIDIMKNILTVISEYKPGYCVLVGGSSLLAGFVNEMVPVLTIGTTQSGNVTTLADFQTVEKIFYNISKNIAENVGKKENHLIPAKFTFDLKEQKSKFRRSDFNILENSFVVVLIGGRLKEEISEELLQMLNDLVEDDNDINVVTVGGFEKNKNFEKLYPALDKTIRVLGMQDDVLAILELCDLYVNPIRRGGATSAVEALYKGVPVVTVNYGDVAGTVEEKFICNDLNEMKELILKYKNDSEFYNQQSKYALEQARICMDTDTEFERILNIYKERMK